MPLTKLNQSYLSVFMSVKLSLFERCVIAKIGSQELCDLQENKKISLEKLKEMQQKFEDCVCSQKRFLELLKMDDRFVKEILKKFSFFKYCRFNKDNIKTIATKLGNEDFFETASILNPFQVHDQSLIYMAASSGKLDFFKYIFNKYGPLSVTSEDNETGGAGVYLLQTVKNLDVFKYVEDNIFRPNFDEWIDSNLYMLIINCVQSNNLDLVKYVTSKIDQGRLRSEYFQTIPFYLDLGDSANIDLVKYLNELNFDLNITCLQPTVHDNYDYGGVDKTVFHIALEKGNLKFIQQLDEIYNFKSHKYEYPLICSAICSGKREVIDFILSENDKDNINEVLSVCAEYGNLDIFKFFISYFKIDPQDLNKITDRFDHSLLSYCGRSDNIDLISYILEICPSLLQNKQDCVSLLCLGIFHNNFEIVKYILEKDSSLINADLSIASINTRGCRTIFDLAIFQLDQVICLSILELVPNIKDLSSEYSLDNLVFIKNCAVANLRQIVLHLKGMIFQNKNPISTHYKITKILKVLDNYLQREVFQNGKNPLHFAVERGDKDLFDNLSWNGWDIKALDDLGRSTFDLAILGNDYELVIKLATIYDLEFIFKDGKIEEEILSKVSNEKIKNFLKDLGKVRRLSEDLKKKIDAL